MYYSIDLRKKVIEYLKKGKSKVEASKVFGVTRQTIYNWIRLEEKGELGGKKRKPKRMFKNV